MKNFQKEDIVLILPPSRWKDDRYSLGMLYVSASLKNAGFDNIIIERGLFKKEFKKYDFELAKKLIIQKVKELKPKIIGFTLNVQEFDQVIELNNEFKKEFDFISIVGGPQSTADPVNLLKNNVDVAVMNEGEETVVELISCLDKIFQNTNDFNQIYKDAREQFKNILGIAYKNNENEISINPPRPYIDITNQVMPAYDKIDMESYIKINDVTVRGLPLRSGMILTSRGCPYSCTFCDCNKVYGRIIRFRGLDNIKQEIKLLKEKYGIEGLWLADDTFTLNKEHILGICGIMKEFGIIWSCNTRVNLITEELIKIMKDAGCVQFDIGVESGSQRVLDEVINKKISIEQARKTFALCRKTGMRTLVSFMMGLPGETMEEMRQTFNLAKEIKANFYVFSIFTPLPGSSLFDKYYKNEVLPSDYKNLEFWSGNEKFNKSKVKGLKPLNTKWRKELAQEMKKNNLRNPWLLIKIFLKLGNKRERLKFIMTKLKNMIIK